MKINKMEQVLNEIKEISEHCMKQSVCTFCKYKQECSMDDYDTCYDSNKLILKKIGDIEQ